MDIKAEDIFKYLTPNDLDEIDDDAEEVVDRAFEEVKKEERKWYFINKAKHAKKKRGRK